MSFADELRRFNNYRKDTFGAAPRPEKPLPLQPTGVGGDVAPPLDKEPYVERNMGR